ncbi:MULTISPECIES: LuxR C-terminal-related transcriptional regulator [unclassified Pseudomonas]|uniref:LuxR C-terminal-related transcriptional regulator n=1 Tax=unclassified Pseudomonas TaxID=196821 RepID=UPI00069DC85F|nr:MULTISPECIES: LuxR C-terminal-related transcriptional regulator [unclassified Pseudomonas]WPN44775.1 LuxR C-terminal-related transcriptional regulator [Pseudomonas sp. P8_241]
MSQSLSAISLQSRKPVSLASEEAPSPSSRLLPRQHLVAQLLEKPRRLRLLCAPVGYGKTSLIRQCLSRSAPAPLILQLNLAGQPLCLARFCMRIAELLGELAQPVVTGSALLSALEGLKEPCTLVLDDYLAGADTALDAWIDHLLVHSSAPIELWVSCRRRPTWNLPRLLLEGQLLTLDSEALAFSRQESDDLVYLLAPATTQAGLDAIWQQAWGWCAGTRLLLTSPSAAQPMLYDYLERELLSHLSAEQCSLLCGLAYLPRFCQALCAELWEELHDKACLHQLLMSHAFFQALDSDGQWYRILPAVAQALQGRMDASAVNRLRLRACRGLSASGFIEDAIDLALSAGRADVAANYMATLNPSWLLSGRNLQRLLDWRKHLPARLQSSTPQLVVLIACALMMNMRLNDAQAALEQLSQFLPQPSAQQNRRLLALWQALSGSINGLLGNCTQAMEYCQAALEHLGEDEQHLSFVCTVILARMAMSTGATVQAQQILMLALEKARRQGSLIREVQVNTQRICLMILCGESDLAERLLQHNLSLLQADGNRDVMLLGRLLVLQGKLHLQRGEQDCCERTLKQALQLLGAHNLSILHALTGLSQVCACRGDFQQAFALLQDAERHMQCADAQESSYRAVLNLQTLSVLIHQKNWKQALLMAQMIEQYLRGSAARLTCVYVPSLAVHSQLLLAIVEQGIGQSKDAGRRLETVLRECRRLNFHGLEAKALRLLDDLTRDTGASHPARQPTRNNGTFNLVVSEARVVPPRQSAVSTKQHEQLTSREMAVLELLAEGFSNREISERLYISTNTVKAHIKHINSKLGVTRRAQAVMRAKATGVLV